ncbi:MAG: LAGLIDADG family homing endonuclease [Ktedonobacterales bacterium]
MARNDEERDLIAVYQQGMSVPELASRYGIHDKRIYYVLKKSGITLRPRSGVGKVLSQEQEESLIDAYQQGMDAATIASRYEISSSTVYTTLESHRVKRRTNSEIFRKLTPLQVAEIIALYQQGLPASQIVRHNVIHDQTVYNILERHGIQRRSASEAALTYSRNEHAFDVIDNEEAAYWLGFIAADGNVSNGRLRIGLSTKDADHLRKLAAWLSPDRPFYTGMNNLGRPVSTLEIGSQHLVETLATYGIVARKTYVMKCLPTVAPLLMRHFLRGYVDADGYISLRIKGGARFGVVSFNREIVEEIQNWLMQELGVSRISLVHSGVAWHYRQYGSEQVRKIVSYLYNEAMVYLDRKYQLAYRILSGPTHSPRQPAHLGTSKAQ